MDGICDGSSAKARGEAPSHVHDAVPDRASRLLDSRTALEIPEPRATVLLDRFMDLHSLL
jgi:hypothetical protein